MSFSATEFEFKHRFWIFLVLFWGSFALFRTDHTYFSLALAQWMADHRLIVSPDHVARDAWIIIALGSIITGPGHGVVLVGAAGAAKVAGSRMVRPGNRAKSAPLKVSSRVTP